MSSNKSENLGLHLWEGEDDFLRTEFNENFQQIDEKVGPAYTPTNKPYVVGVYTGNGETQTITLGFSPSFLFIGNSNTAPNTSNPMQYAAFIGSSGSGTNAITLESDGFSVKVASSGSCPDLNMKSRRYAYLAFY